MVKRWGTRGALGSRLDIAPGVTGLLGANGAGKTTLLGMMLGLHRPDAGTLSGVGPRPRPPPGRRSAPASATPPSTTAPARRARPRPRRATSPRSTGSPIREATGRASDALWQVGLGEERFRPIGTMSTGQRQRVKLAQAIAHDPQLVLLDEPTDGLDPVQRDEMLELIRRIGTEFGIDVLLSSHLLEEVERVCDAVVILRDGVVAASGSINVLRGRGRCDRRLRRPPRLGRRPRQLRASTAPSRRRRAPPSSSHLA